MLRTFTGIAIVFLAFILWRLANSTPINRMQVVLSFLIRWSVFGESTEQTKQDSFLHY